LKDYLIVIDVMKNTGTCSSEMKFLYRVMELEFVDQICKKDSFGYFGGLMINMMSYFGDLSIGGMNKDKDKFVLDFVDTLMMN
jgi:hypothetical protein